MHNKVSYKVALTLLITGLCLSLPIGLAKEDAALNGHVSYSMARTYRVGSGDLLTIKVYPQTEYSAEQTLVRADGNVTFPIVGQMNVSGKTIDEIQEEVEAQLKKTIRNYSVDISVVNTRPAIFYLSGAVTKLGPLEVLTDARETVRAGQSESFRRTEQSLVNILANAGGVKLNADLSQVQVKNGESGAVESYNVWKVLKEADASQNPWLNSGDSIFIPELPQGQLMPDPEFNALANSVIAPKNFPVRVIGQVQNPNLVHLEGETPLLSTAVAMAGGYTPQGLQKAVAVRRFTDEHHFSTILVDATKNDITLRPNDIVYVGEAKLYKAGRYMDQVAHVLSPFEAAAMTSAMSAQTFGFGGWHNRFGGGTTSK